MMDRVSYALYGAKAMALRGNDLPQSKLTPQIVRTIRAEATLKTAKQQAREFGVHYRTIEKVRSYETWGHV